MQLYLVDWRTVTRFMHVGNSWYPEIDVEE